ncbi:MAG: type II toxin-antitoxin system VapC family toxin [Dehalococcoidia bacterium]
MTYLIDSDWTADWLKGRPQAVALLRSLAPAGLRISAVTVGEIYEGIYYGRDPAGQERVFRQFRRFVSTVPITQPILNRFARERGALRAQGLLIGDFDLLIAATALVRGYTLVTRNARHFGRIPGLLIHQPTTT